MCVIKGLDNYVENKKELCEINDSIDRGLFGKYGVKRVYPILAVQGL